MTVGQLLAAASSRELSEWEALYTIEAEDRVKHDVEQGLAEKAQQHLRAKKRR